MAKRKPRLLVRIKRKASKEDSIPVESYVPPVKTEVDLLYEIIDERCCYGYRLCENEVALPWIRKEDIEDKGDGLFVIRFRCPVESEKYGLPQVVKDVCERVGSKEHLIYEKKEEYGLPFIEAAWVLQRGEVYVSEGSSSGCGGTSGSPQETGSGGIQGEECGGESQATIPACSCEPHCGDDEESSCSLSDEEMKRMIDATDESFA